MPTSDVIGWGWVTESGRRRDRGHKGYPKNCESIVEVRAELSTSQCRVKYGAGQLNASVGADNSSFDDASSSSSRITPSRNSRCFSSTLIGSRALTAYGDVMGYPPQISGFLVILHIQYQASITASATFGHSASPDNVTWWHTMVLQWAMKICVKYFDRLCHRNPLYSNYLQTHFISMTCKRGRKIK